MDDERWLKLGLDASHEAQHVEKHVRVGGCTLVGPLIELQLRHAAHSGGRCGRAEAACSECGAERLQARRESAAHVELAR